MPYDYLHQAAEPENHGTNSTTNDSQDNDLSRLSLTELRQLLQYKSGIDDVAHTLLKGGFAAQTAEYLLQNHLDQLTKDGLYFYNLGMGDISAEVIFAAIYGTKTSDSDYFEQITSNLKTHEYNSLTEYLPEAANRKLREKLIRSALLNDKENELFDWTVALSSAPKLYRTSSAIFTYLLEHHFFGQRLVERLGYQPDNRATINLDEMAFENLVILFERLELSDIIEQSKRSNSQHAAYHTLRITEDALEWLLERLHKQSQSALAMVIPFAEQAIAETLQRDLDYDQKTEILLAIYNSLKHPEKVDYHNALLNLAEQIDPPQKRLIAVTAATGLSGLATLALVLSILSFVSLSGALLPLVPVMLSYGIGMLGLTVAVGSSIVLLRDVLPIVAAPIYDRVGFFAKKISVVAEPLAKQAGRIAAEQEQYEADGVEKPAPLYPSLSEWSSAY